MTCSPLVLFPYKSTPCTSNLVLGFSGGSWQLFNLSTKNIFSVLILSKMAGAMAVAIAPKCPRLGTKTHD